jgi:hypothetical protein
VWMTAYIGRQASMIAKAAQPFLCGPAVAVMASRVGWAKRREAARAHAVRVHVGTARKRAFAHPTFSLQ